MATRSLTRLLGGTFFVLASVFCFIAYIPYTYLFLVKAPPTAWLEWFIAHGTLLYWLAFLTGLTALRSANTRRMVAAILGVQALVGVAFTVHHTLQTLVNNGTAVAWAVVCLLPFAALCAVELWGDARESTGRETGMFGYTAAVLLGLATGSVSYAAYQIRQHALVTDVIRRPHGFAIFLIVVAAHVWVACCAISVLNLVAAASRARGGRWVATASILGIGGVLGFSTAEFLSNTVSLGGWMALLYSLLLGFALSVWGAVLLRPFTAERNLRTVVAAIVLGAALIAAALAIPTLLIDNDWNGLFQSAAALAIWIALGVLVYATCSIRKQYSVPAILLAVVLSTFGYGALRATAFFWTHQLGETQDDVDQTMAAYRLRNLAYGMIPQLVAKEPDQRCGPYCLTLRQYTNIPNAKATEPLRLVENLQPNTAARPNIFIIVIDSMRQDYLGAYNSEVTFTPHLDVLAKDSVVFRHAFTNYAGTSLSEPALWAGSVLLHAHYMRPFSNVNSLGRLSHADGYQMIVSYDHVLRQLFADNEDAIKLDTKIRWNELEISQTLGDLESLMDAHSYGDRPVMFYAQPMNIHELGENRLPKSDPAFHVPRNVNPRVALGIYQADAAIGRFVEFLKARGLYDNSILVVTADHGDGLGFQGRNGHSNIIFPEIMRVPLIVHVPPALRKNLVSDPDRIVALTDIVPTLYYLLGHRPIEHNAVFGRPLFAESQAELDSYRRDHLFLASDSRAGYGELSGDGRWMFVTYDVSAQSELWDLENDPLGTHNLITPATEQKYKALVMDDLRAIADFYHYRPSGGHTGDFQWDKIVKGPGHRVKPS